MLNSVLVFLGSGLGGFTRYQVGLWSAKTYGTSFPYGTITINISGSFLIALVMGLSLRTTWIAPEVRLFLTTGIMGGYTTYSSFNYETLALVQQGAWGLGALNFVVTGALCLVAGLLGLGLAQGLASLAGK